MREMKIENTGPKKEEPREVQLPLTEEEFNYSHARTGAYSSAEPSVGDGSSLAGDGADSLPEDDTSAGEIPDTGQDGNAGLDGDDLPGELNSQEPGRQEGSEPGDVQSGASDETYAEEYGGDDRESDDPQDDADYEARRAQRMERLRKRKRRRKIRRLTTGILIVAAAVIAGAAIYYGDRLKFGSTSGEPQSTVADKDQNQAGTGIGAADGSGTDNGTGTDDGAAGGTGTDSGSGTDNGGGTENGEAGGAGTENGADGAAGTDNGADGSGQGDGSVPAEQESILAEARFHAAQYDYDKAIELLKGDPGYAGSQEMQQAVAEFEETKASCVSWPLEEVTHVFYHSLIVDTSKAFDGDYKEGDYNQVMTTVDEFNKITQMMYDRGYVMVSIYDMASVNEDGTMSPGEILLPPGKIPFVLSQDDLSYYHYMEGDGYPVRLIVDENGKVRNEYLEDDGSVSVGDYDVVPLIDRFVEEHPDFSYRGAKGIVALTGYNGILGYRTDISYKTRPDDLDANKVAWLDAHPDFKLKRERKGAKKVAKAMRDNGWLFASHTWGHKNIADVTMERLMDDTQRFKENVDPLIGGTDIIIFAFGTDLTQQEDYSGEKFEFLKGQGYNYFCNVDSQKYFVQIRDRYFRMGRRNLDGYRMYYNPELLEDLFDVQEVFDPARPVPVPPMG